MATRKLAYNEAKVQQAIVMARTNDIPVSIALSKLFDGMETKTETKQRLARAKAKRAKKKQAKTKS